MEEPRPCRENLQMEFNFLNCIQFIIPNHKNGWYGNRLLYI